MTTTTTSEGGSSSFVRHLADNSIDGDAPAAELEAFFAREERDLLGSADPELRALGRLYATGCRRAFARWNSSFNGADGAGVEHVKALQLALVSQIVEVISAFDVDPDEAEELVLAMGRQIVLRSIIGVGGSLAAKALRERGDA